MLKMFLLPGLLFPVLMIAAQPVTYVEEMKDHRELYVIKHEVVQGKDKKYFRFYPVNEVYRVVANLESISDTVGFIMKTSGTKDKKFFRYATLHFILDGLPQRLTMFQSAQLMKDSTFKNYLFLPFTDHTSGGKSYAGGRYIDLETGDINNQQVIIDFNKAYNPYCAYSTGYNCPIPPRENDLSIPIKAGEKKFKGAIKSRK